MNTDPNSTTQITEMSDFSPIDTNGVPKWTETQNLIKNYIREDAG